MAWLVEKKGLTRIRASFVCGFVTWFVGLGTVFSFNIWESYKLFGKTFFDLLDFLTANIIVAAGWFVLLRSFVGWIMRTSSVEDEIAIENPVYYRAWRFLVKYVTPVGVFLIFLRVLGII